MGVYPSGHGPERRPNIARHMPTPPAPPTPAPPKPEAQINKERGFGLASLQINKNVPWSVHGLRAFVMYVTGLSAVAALVTGYVPTIVQCMLVVLPGRGLLLEVQEQVFFIFDETVLFHQSFAICTRILFRQYAILHKKCMGDAAIISLNKIEQVSCEVFDILLEYYSIKLPEVFANTDTLAGSDKASIEGLDSLNLGWFRARSESHGG